MFASDVCAYLIGFYNQASFADDGAVLLISQASVEDISNKSMQQWGGAAVPAANFRPNIVISLDNETERQDEKELPGESLSTLQPFDEDKWLAIQIGEVKFMVYEACSRCKMIGTYPPPSHSLRVQD